MTGEQTVLRHTLAVRILHWLIAGSGLMLVFSGFGFMPLYGRFYLNNLPGLQWVSDFQTQMNLHYLSAILFMAACLFHLVYHWRRGEKAVLPQRGDVRASWLIIKAMLTGGEEPANDKFLAEQRLTYAAFVGVSIILSATGYLLAIKSQLSTFIEPRLLQVLVLLHLATTFLFLTLVGLHLAAFLLKVNRPLFLSIFNGRVKRSYARQRHARWRNQ